MIPVAVTPSDVTLNNALLGTSPNQFMADQLWVGVSGDVIVYLSDGSTFTYTAVAAGGWHDMPFFRGVKATGTTATGIKATRKRRIQ